MGLRTLTLFLSSPGDCVHERRATERVVQKLLRDPYLQDRFILRVEASDAQGRTVPMVATRPPQESVDLEVKRPQDCDVCVGIFRGRMGTPLPRKKFQKEDGSAFESGSEYEFHQAWKQAQRTQGAQPYILLYRGPANAKADSRQRKKVDAFFESSWVQALDGSQHGGFHTFKTTRDFAEQLEHHLRTYLHRQAPWLRQPFDQWLQDSARRLAKDAGPRFTPEVHVETPLAKAFHAVLRLPQALKELDDALGEVFALVRYTEELESSRQALRGVATALGQLEPWEAPPDFERIQAVLRALEKRCIEGLDTVSRKKGAKGRAARGSSPPGDTASSSVDRTYLLQAAAIQCSSVLDLVEQYAPLMESPVLLLHGSAGQGKTHALVDQVLRHVQQGGVAVGVLGQQLTGTGDLWQEIFARLGIAGDTTPDQFLATLSAEARRRQCMALIAFDALNETQPRSRWRVQLAGMLEQARKYSNIAVVFSVRSDYLKSTLPPQDEAGRTAWNECEVRGFAGVEAEALLRFFAHYGLEAPVSPPIIPELSNPLYLKLLCLSMRGHGRIRGLLPSWLDVRDGLIDHLEGAALEDAALGIDETAKSPIRRALNQLADTLLESGSLSIDRARAEEIANRYAHGRPLIAFFISNDILMKVPGPNPDDDFLQFAFERLSDTFLADRLLGRMADAEGRIGQKRLIHSFSQGGELHALVSDSPGSPPYNAPGLLKALALEIPRRTGQELVEIIPPAGVSKRRVAMAFFDSLLWRNQDREFGVSPLELRKLLEQWEACLPWTFSKRVDFYIRLSLIPGHPLQVAKFLHPGLSAQKSLGDRDALWSVHLANSWKDEGATLSILTQWTDAYGFKELEPDVAAPLALVLMWACASSHTGQREAATRGLCRVLNACPGIVENFLPALTPVDDAYVVESSLRAVLGVVEVQKNQAWVSRIGRLVYQQHFPQGGPRWCHLFIRHYARSIVERAAAVTKPGEIDLARVVPPHASHLELGSVPSIEQLRAMDESRGYRAIVRSCTSGDFFLYELGGNSGGARFFARPLPSSTEPERPYRRSEALLGGAAKAESFDIALMGRFIAHNCLKLGWTSQRFNSFDEEAMHSDVRIHAGGRIERIGKKYQWIGWRTLQAFLTDHYYVSADRRDGSKVYETPRDLRKDLPAPSLWLVPPKRAERPFKSTAPDGGEPSQPWPEPTKPSIQAWIQNPHVEPAFPTLLHRVPPEAGDSPATPWIRANIFQVWERPWVPGEWAEPDFVADIRWMGRAQVIQKSSLRRLLEDLKKPQVQERLRSIGRPEIPRADALPLDRWSALKGELAVGFIHANQPGIDWDEYFPVPYAHLFAEMDTHERIITLPTPWLIQQWQLQLDRESSGYRLPDGRLLFRNFALAGGPDAVFASLPALAERLEASGWVLAWMIHGERHALVENSELAGWVNTQGVAWFDGERAQVPWMHRERKVRSMGR
ncbi:hypothetical protein [Pyxidicoccus trucidator]|uniref:hypothetical protein n=1 Tax=Pyxidicoccus trucidator TaxID=2709662 RepID=UPI0013DA9072|nr:hypothetical protein [Pyxidicoccus trucidator]